MIGSRKSPAFKGNHGLVMAAFCLGCFGCSPRAPAPANAAEPARGQPDTRARLARLVLPRNPAPPADVTNRFADDPRAAALGQKFFFDRRFSGPLLDTVNDGSGGTLGKKGEVAKVACASCHVPENRAFVDTRSPRQQLSLGSGWTHRRAPSLLDVAQTRFLMWDGRRDTFFGQVFVPVESPVEFNSSRLFVAQQIARLYRREYEEIFGSIPAIDQYAPLEASDAGCAQLPPAPPSDGCPKPGHADRIVIGIVANFGKAIQAYVRLLSCGRSRFDTWMDGDETALSSDEQAGAALFVGKAGCDGCHAGPYLTDQGFHNMGLAGQLVPFTGVNTAGDRGAAAALPQLLNDLLNSAGHFSDGNDARLERLPSETSGLLGAFRTPSLRCVGRRPSFMHDGRYRSLNDVIRFFNRGGDASGYPGVTEGRPRGLTKPEMKQLLAFLLALDGQGPAPSLLAAPSLPP